MVHRDIKPANIFIGREDSLILGDFGLVFVPDRPARITAHEGETVGVGDFIPPATWRGLGVRHEHVKTNFDVYMLGKVLWCMVTGKPKLDREYWNEPENDVTQLFPGDPHMHMINVILAQHSYGAHNDSRQDESGLFRLQEGPMNEMKRAFMSKHTAMNRAMVARACSRT